MADKTDFSGMKPDDLKAQGRQSLEKALGDKTKQQTETQEKGDETPQPEKSESTETSPEKSEPETSQDATSELSKYDNVLLNTYGVTEEELEKGVSPEKVRKLAKSWSEIQSTATKAKQEASQYQQYKQTVEGLNELLEQYPSLYDKLQQAKQGQYQENPTQEPISGQPEQTGQLDNYDVSEDQLIKQGYLNEGDLDGLDELAKTRKILRAEAKYIREQESKNYVNDIRNQQQKLRQQQEAEQVKTENERRLNEGFDNFVAKYGINFAELDDQVMNQVQKRMMATLDPDDPRKIAEDAFEIAATRVLPQHGIELGQPVQTGGKSITQIEDTGKSFSKSTQTSQKKESVDDQLRKRAYQRFARSNDPKAKYKQKVS